MANSQKDPNQVMAEIVSAGQQFWQQFTSGQAGAEAPASQGDPGAQWAALPQQFLEMQRRTLESMAAFWTGMQMPTGEAVSDKRFAADAWSKDPRFDMLRRGYLAYADFVGKAIEHVPVDAETKDRMRFGVRQAIDAMSPSNFFATNPEAVQLALETGGRSLVDGMNLFMQDFAKGRVSMTDETAFAVGKDLALTPGSVVFENELIQLIQYAPTTKEVYERPLVIVPPCINKFYILDLQPENSFVRYAVGEGHTVFLVSWRNVADKLGTLTWDDYLQRGVFKAIDIAREIAKVDDVNTLGFCVGGTLLASALGVFAANDEEKVASMTLLTTMLDFSDAGEIGHLITPEAVASKEATIGKGGLLQGKELAQVFSSLRANDLIWQYVVNSYLKGKAPPAFDLLYWNSDATNLPGPMFCWYVRNMYLENRLREPGKTIQCDVPIDLGEIDVPAYLYASREDHIVPWGSAFKSRELLGGETTFVLGASGHIAGVINAPAKKKRNYWVEGRDTDDPDTWLEHAKSIPGSWWPHWSEWLAQYGGEMVKARKPGNRKYKPIEPAPGRYVLERGV